VFYRNEHAPIYGERIQQRIPTYLQQPPATQPIAAPDGRPITDLTRLLARLTIPPTA
jgi:hypothetical protein